jgi:flagella basal body P-ring formation protein FlgA
MTNATIRNSLLFALTMALCSTFVAADSITLRTSVRLTGDSNTVYLRDIAELSGEEARKFADVAITVVTDGENVHEIPLRQVRQALEDQNIHWGRVNLNGRSVLVRPRARSMASAPLPMAGASVAVDEPRETRRVRETPVAQLAAEFIKARNLRGAIAEFLAVSLGVNPSHLRLEFDPRDELFLATSLDALRFEIEPTTSVRSNRVDLAVRIWDDGTARERRSVRVSPTIQLPVVALKREVGRGAMLTEQDIEIVQQWLPPVHGGLVTSEHDAVGRIATVRLSEGDALREQHVRRETLIRRGELVIVRALVGGSVISLHAEARADGSEGDMIEFRKVGERESFLAIVTARNEAVIDLQR